MSKAAESKQWYFPLQSKRVFFLSTLWNNVEKHPFFTTCRNDNMLSLGMINETNVGKQPEKGCFLYVSNVTTCPNTRVRFNLLSKRFHMIFKTAIFCRTRPSSPTWTKCTRNRSWKRLTAEKSGSSDTSQRPPSTSPIQATKSSSLMRLKGENTTSGTRW